MRKSIFLILFLYSNSFACYGCIDAPAAQEGSETIKKAYDTADSILAKTIDSLTDSVSKVMKSEVINHKTYAESTQFQIDSIAHLKALTFLKNSQLLINTTPSKKVLE